LTQGIEIGAGWPKKSEIPDMGGVDRSIAAPEFGPKKLYANLTVPLCPKQKTSYLELHSCD
jgi:uncharacterized protein (DUF736 family)